MQSWLNALCLCLVLFHRRSHSTQMWHKFSLHILKYCTGVKGMPLVQESGNEMIRIIFESQKASIAWNRFTTKIMPTTKWTIAKLCSLFVTSAAIFKSFVVVEIFKTIQIQRLFKKWKTTRALEISHVVRWYRSLQKPKLFSKNGQMKEAWNKLCFKLVFTIEQRNVFRVKISKNTKP